MGTVGRETAFKRLYFGLQYYCGNKTVWFSLELFFEIEVLLLYNINVSKVMQLDPTLCDPMDCSLPDSSLHGILQARTPELIAISFFSA